MPSYSEIPNASSGAVSIISTNTYLSNFRTGEQGLHSAINPKTGTEYVVIIFILVVSQMITTGLKDTGNPPKGAYHGGSDYLRSSALASPRTGPLQSYTSQQI